MNVIDHQNLIRDLRDRTTKYVQVPTYSSVTAFLIGCDVGNSGGVLDGFHEWLVLKADDFDEYFWTGQVLRLAFPDTPQYWNMKDLPPDKDRIAMEVLFDLLDEFFRELATRFGRRRLKYDYVIWLQSRPWHDAQLVRFGRGGSSKD